MKKKSNKGDESAYYFWRDQKGHEIDLIEDFSTYLLPIEVKLSETFNTSFTKNMKYLNSLQAKEIEKINLKGFLVYCGDDENLFKNVQLKHWLNFLAQLQRQEAISKLIN